jgi:hypothetical protein
MCGVRRNKSQMVRRSTIAYLASGRAMPKWAREREMRTRKGIMYPVVP